MLRLFDLMVTVPAGTEARSTQDVVSVCQSLHRVALQCQQDAEGCWYFHQTVVPCLLAMAVQAAMEGKCRAAVGEGSRQLPGSQGSLILQSVLLLMPFAPMALKSGLPVPGPCPSLVWVQGAVPASSL